MQARLRFEPELLPSSNLLYMLENRVFTLCVAYISELVEPTQRNSQQFVWLQNSVHPTAASHRLPVCLLLNPIFVSAETEQVREQFFQSLKHSEDTGHM